MRAHLESTSALRRFVLALLLMLFAAAGPLSFTASAQTEASDVLIRRGVDLMRQGEVERAFALFQQAFEIAHTPRAMAQMGLAAGALERWVDADGYLRMALSAESDPWIRRHQDELRRPLELIGQHVGEIAVGGPTGAMVFIDDVERGRLPLERAIRVTTGRHRIRLMDESGEVGSAEVELSGGDRREIAIRPPEPEGTDLPSEPQPEGEGLSTLSVVGVALAGVGGALLIGGAITGGLALDAQAQTDAACGPDPTNCAPGFERPRDQLRTLALATDVMLPVGAAVAITGGVLLLLPMLSGEGEQSEDEVDSGPRAGLSCGPAGCVASLRGSFR